MGPIWTEAGSRLSGRAVMPPAWLVAELGINSLASDRGVAGEMCVGLTARPKPSERPNSA
jgi:hypothetical protein